MILQILDKVKANSLSFAELTPAEIKFLTDELVTDKGQGFSALQKALLAGFYLTVNDTFQAAIDTFNTTSKFKIVVRTTVNNEKLVPSFLLTDCGTNDHYFALRTHLFTAKIKPAYPDMWPAPPSLTPPTP